MKLLRTKGATSQSEYVYIRHATTGAALPGLAYNTASLTAYYVRGNGTPTAITLATLATAQTAWTSGGFVEVDATNMPGLYRIDPPNAFYASAANSAVLMLKGAANMETVALEVQLTSMDVNDSVHLGITALPNAAAEAAGGLFTRGTGAGQINQSANGLLDTDVVRISGDATAANNCESFFDGTGYAGTGNIIPTVSSVTAIATGGIVAASFAANAIDAGALAATAATEIAAAIWASAIEDQPTTTAQAAMSIMLSFAAGRSANGGATFKSPNNAEDRIVATVNGSNERTAITLTPAVM